jgi:hypothetical protein
MGKARGGAISPGTFVPVLTLEGKCFCWRAKPAHLGGHLPHIYEEIGLFEKRGFPDSYRRVRGRKDERAMSVPPHVVLYRARGDGVQIRRIRDSRLRRVGLW